MKSLLVDLLNDIISGCNKFLTTLDNDSETSKDNACNRLKLVLMHDRTKLPPHMLEQMRDELVEVISKYVEIDKELLDLNLASEGNSIALMASIPVLRAKVQDEDQETNENSKETEPTTEEVENNEEAEDENNTKEEETEASEIVETTDETTEKEIETESKEESPKKTV